MPAWDFKTAEGEKAAPGKYKVRLTSSKDTEYVFTGENKIYKISINSNASNEENEFEITI